MDIMKTVMAALGDDGLKRISQQLGTDEKTTGQATQATLSTLLGGLARNASKADGAEKLHHALAKDHDGGVLDNPGGLLENPSSGNGDGILSHLLGSQRGTVENGIGNVTGMDSGAAGKLMTMLAPMMMGALGKAQRQGGMDASGVANLLGNEQRRIEAEQPKETGLLGKLLDSDNDGDVDLEDLAKRGAGIFNKLTGR